MNHDPETAGPAATTPVPVPSSPQRSRPASVTPERGAATTVLSQRGGGRRNTAGPGATTPAVATGRQRPGPAVPRDLGEENYRELARLIRRVHARTAERLAREAAQ